VVDMRAQGAAETFTRSLKETGFAVVTGHGLDYGLVTQVYAEWREFFLSGAADQAQYLRDLAKQDGFFNVKEAESAKGMEVKDLKQYYQLYFPHGRYPAEVSDAAQRLFAALIELGGKLLQWVDEHMDETVRSRVLENLRKNNISKISDTIDASQTMLRILRYPPTAEIEEKLNSKIEAVRPGAVRAAAHEDINLITLLPAGSSRGLEVKDVEGNWHEVPLCKESIIVNIGDMLQEMTNGEYKATTHRVVVPEGEDGSGDRMSCPCFIHPVPGTYLSDTWPRSEDYLMQRLRELGVAGNAKM